MPVSPPLLFDAIVFAELPAELDTSDSSLMEAISPHHKNPHFSLSNLILEILFYAKAVSVFRLFNTFCSCIFIFRIMFKFLCHSEITLQF